MTQSSLLGVGYICGATSAIGWGLKTSEMSRNALRIGFGIFALVILSLNISDNGFIRAVQLLAEGQFHTETNRVSMMMSLRDMLLINAVASLCPYVFWIGLMWIEFRNFRHNPTFRKNALFRMVANVKLVLYQIFIVAGASLSLLLLTAWTALPFILSPLMTVWVALFVFLSIYRIENGSPPEFILHGIATVGRVNRWSCLRRSARACVFSFNSVKRSARKECWISCLILIHFYQWRMTPILIQFLL
nr:MULTISPECIES: hypothetical protein [Providencia]